jgi:hypothetical protein
MAATLISLGIGSPAGVTPFLLLGLTPGEVVILDPLVILAGTSRIVRTLTEDSAVTRTLTDTSRIARTLAGESTLE